MIGPLGTEVPSQLIEGGKKAAVATTLPASATWTWSLNAGPGAAPAPANPVQLSDQGTYYEMTNGLTGVRITKPGADPKNRLAPIQGIRLRDGTWTARGPSHVRAGVGGALLEALAMTTIVIEQGPLLTVLEVSYTYTQPIAGTYRSTITLKAGHPSILLDEDITGVNVLWSVDIYDAVQPNQGRYRGHSASLVELGYEEATHRVYRPFHQRSSMDAFRDLQYIKPLLRDHYASETTAKPVHAWDPWASNTGWYWMLYNAQAGTAAPVVGAFAGRASRAIGAHMTGPSIFTTPVGVTDLTTAVDSGGNVLAVYRGGRDVWFLRLNSALSGSAPLRLGSELNDADLLALPDGRASVVAYDWMNERMVFLEEDASGGFTAPAPLPIPAGFTLGDRTAYQTYWNSEHLLILFGAYGGVSGAHLFSRPAGNASFVYRDTLSNARATRNVERPALQTVPGQGVVFAYADGTHLYRATVSTAWRFVVTGSAAAGSASWPGMQTGGASIDPMTGDVLVHRSSPPEWFYVRTSGVLQQAADLNFNHYGQGTNRRTLASAPGGTALAVHDQEIWKFAGTQWERFTQANDLGIEFARVHWHPGRGEFLLIGRHQGALKVYSWQPRHAAPALSAEIAGTEQRSAGFTFASRRSGPDGRTSDRSRMHWGIFVGTRGTDLLPSDQVQPINLEMNLHGGFGLNKIYRYAADFPETPGDWGGLFMDKAVVADLMHQVRHDRYGPHGSGILGYLWKNASDGRELLELWADKTGAKNREKTAAVVALAQDILNQLVHGDGIYCVPYHYWHGGLAMSRVTALIDSLLAEPLTLPEDRAMVKSAASVFANILWDDDFAPLGNGAISLLNLGTANMPVQQSSYRDMYALFLKNHPRLADKAVEMQQHGRAHIESSINEYGAHMGATGYIGASLGPTLNMLQQLQRTGYDLFATDPRLAKLGEFMMHLMTPPEPRFGELRKVVASGDGATIGPFFPGQIGTALRPSHPELSARLMGAWHQGGKVHSGFNVTSILTINENLPTAEPNLGDCDFPGYMTVLRHGWGTAGETAAWMWNGDWLRDHRNDDRGQLILYALKAPLTVSWGAFYYPGAPAGNMKGTIVPEKSYTAAGTAWNADDQPINRLDSGWNISSAEPMASFAHSAGAHGRMEGAGKIWDRHVQIIRFQEDLPVIVISDLFSGTVSRQPMVFSLPMMAEGTVDSTVGAFNPPARLWDNYGTRKEMPSVSPTRSLGVGLNRMSFTGQTWPKHPSQGVDWDFYTLSVSTQEVVIGNWGHSWHPLREQFQFRQANGRSFEESQHILRMRGTGPFLNVILPYKKGQKPQQTVTEDGGKIRIERANGTIWADGTMSYFVSPEKRVLSSYGDGLAKGGNLSIQGGPGEIVVEGGNITLTAHGKPGVRELYFPGVWRVAGALESNGKGGYYLNFTGDDTPLKLRLTN